VATGGAVPSAGATAASPAAPRAALKAMRDRQHRKPVGP
jgi:hypothetical protein